MKQKKKRAPAFRSTALRISALVLALWALAMGLLTWAVAADMQHQLKSEIRNYANSWSEISFYNHNDRSAPWQLKALWNLGEPYSLIHLNKLLPFMKPHRFVTSSDHWLYGRWNLTYGFEIAEIYRDSDQNIIAQTGNYITFACTSALNWKSENTHDTKYGYVELDESQKELLLDDPAGTNAAALLKTLRLTGHFEGNRFCPTLIEAGSVLPEYIGTSSDAERLMGLDKRGLLTWTTLYSQTPAEGKNTETIYAWNLAGYVSPLLPVTADHTQYADLIDFYLSGDYFQTDNLDSAVYAYTAHPENAGDIHSYTIIVRYWPLEYAAIRLLPTYLITLAAVALCLFLLLRGLRKRLTKPVAQLAEFGVADVDDAWAEPYALEKQFTETRTALAEANTERQQLRTALDYAQNAETSRRQLVSSIAHELKTPLAVIHSYAEGLQAGIAGDKLEQYISTILSETERMDAMVVQMLDLSRLEAGRVRLSTENLSLAALTRTVAERFGLMLEEKGLTVHYDLAPKFTVMADESRMEQVISNLLSNAIKYTPSGGHIRIKIFPHNGQARFLIENTAPHLSEEALEKVWDSFYRADLSRTKPGTGLGLALVKRIIQLHRGTCQVRNTKASTDDVLPTAVEFSFSLPLT